MEKTILLEKKKVAYRLLLRRRTHALRLFVARGGVLTVSAPRTMRQSRIEEFLAQKARWVLDTIRYFKQFPRAVSAKERREHFREHKEKAEALVQERLAHFNQSYQFAWKRVTVRNQKSRWGSCSRKGNLNFNYQLALLPHHLADYIIVHELCHLRELNHSPKFWALVARAVPNHRALRKELRKIGMSLS